MRLLLIRHGNTFHEGQKSVWVGSATDLPLTARGVEQAGAAGRFLATFSTQIRDLYSGPMTRHRQHATEVARVLGMPASRMIVDDRLQEIDYGTWEGRTNGEVDAMGFGTQLQRWNTNAEWPTGAGWTTDEGALAGNVEGFLADAARNYGDPDTVVAVTSGGVLKYFHKLVAEADAASVDSKVATGHVCSVTFRSGRWRVDFWNRPPDGLVP